MVDDEKYYKFYDRKRLTPNGSVISNLLFLRPFIVYFRCCWLESLTCNQGELQYQHAMVAFQPSNWDYVLV